MGLVPHVGALELELGMIVTQPCGFWEMNRGCFQAVGKCLYLLNHLVSFLATDSQICGVVVSCFNLPFHHDC